MTDFAFLRAVNLGKHNKVPMKDLVARLAESGLGPVSYLLASGNLAFTQGAAPGTADSLRQHIAEWFEVQTDAIMRSSAELHSLVGANPYGVPEAGSVQLSMWDGTPDPAGLAELAGMDHAPDRLTLVDGAAIIHYAGSSHDSKLNNNLVMRKLGLPSTLRNVKTLIRLLDKFG